MRLLITLLASLAMTSAYAQSGNNADGKAINNAFATHDKNADGALTKEEVSGDKEISKRFAKFDANKDGKLQEAEYLKAGQDNDKRVLADAAITTKVKSKLLITKGIPSTAISVETYEGTVQLSGFVDSKEQIASAVKVAKAVSGVKAVQNNLKAK